MVLAAVASSVSAPAPGGGGAKASDLFGGGSADSVFAAGKEASVTSDQLSARAIIDAHRRDINRLRGYKVQLTQTEKARLLELREQIQEVERRSIAGTVRQDELEDRVEMLQEADRIIGKPIVDVEADAKLAEYNALRVALLEPKLDSATAKRAAFFERYRDAVETELAANPERRSLIPKLQSAVRRIEALKPLVPTSQLSRAAREAYDDVVELINDHTGVKLELTARERDRVAALEASITKLQASIGPDFAQQPTAGEVARAYTSLGLN